MGWAKTHEDIIDAITDANPSNTDRGYSLNLNNNTAYNEYHNFQYPNNNDRRYVLLCNNVKKSQKSNRKHVRSKFVGDLYYIKERNILRLFLKGNIPSCVEDDLNNNKWKKMTINNNSNNEQLWIAKFNYINKDFAMKYTGEKRI